AQEQPPEEAGEPLRDLIIRGWRRRGRRLRRKSPPEVQVKGQLRMRSLSGAFVMVGISVVLVGMTIAVVGYWPHRGHGGAGAGAGNASSTGDMRREVAAGRPVPHSEKLKLIGPVIMGIGLFIFICANTMLYENRDMETRMLMQKGAWRAATRWTCPWAASGPTATAPTGCRPRPELLQRPGASPTASLLSLHSEGTLGLSSAVGALALSAPMLSPTTQGHSKSLDLGRPGVLLVAPIKDRKNRSWPRLDHVTPGAYAKLENQGESSDRLLEPNETPRRAEPRPSSWAVGVEGGSRV
uniref:Transmembrane protein 200B n=1 Tax=Anas platyrhynchos TaxID=8839 RepID=A0A8B9T8I2_ANAPL